MSGLEAEVLRVYGRYQREFVEALGICPWAERARRSGRVQPEVRLETDPDVGRLLPSVRRLARDPAVDIGLLIFPRVTWDQPTFERFVGALRRADEAGGPVVMAMAAFHPEAAPDTSDPGRLVPLLRRTPDPTIQLVRRTVLEAIRRPGGHGTGFIDPSQLDVDALLDEPCTPPLHERVAQANLERVRALGVDRVSALLDDIRRDRDRSYARFVR